MVSEDQIRAFLPDADALIAAAGAVLVVPKAAARRAAHVNDHATSRANGSAANDRSSFFKRVNRAALENLARWVPQLFPRAALQQTGAYRVTSADLGRDFEEDLSIHPDGVQDFGPRKGLSPIDVMIEFGGAPSPQEAAHTLCEWMGHSPAEFGWKEPRSNGSAKEPPPHAPCDDTEADAHGKANGTNTVQAPTFFDPWANPPPPAFPGRILRRDIEDAVFATALRNGFCPGVLAMAELAAISGAASKAIRFTPYQNSTWWVPPIIWVMPILEVGQRKTAIQEIAFAPVRAAHSELWRHHRGRMRTWHALSPKDKHSTPKPIEPHSFTVDDVTVEKLQEILAENDRGTVMVRDEIAGLLEFGRYGGTGDAARSYLCETYEATEKTVSRAGRDSLHINCNGLTIYGAIQPDRLKDFPDLAKDGLLQRFNMIRAVPVSASREEIVITGTEKIADRITALTRIDAGRYKTTPEGSALIRETEALGKKLSTITGLRSRLPGHL